MSKRSKASETSHTPSPSKKGMTTQIPSSIKDTPENKKLLKEFLDVLMKKSQVSRDRAMTTDEVIKVRNFKLHIFFGFFLIKLDMFFVFSGFFLFWTKKNRPKPGRTRPAGLRVYFLKVTP